MKSFEARLSYALGLCQRRAGTGNKESTRELCNCVEEPDGEKLLSEIVRRAHTNKRIEAGARLLFNLSSLNDAAARFGVKPLATSGAADVVTFPAYTPDGPGYSGQVEVLISGRQMTVRTSQDGGTYIGHLQSEFPSIASSRGAGSVNLRDLFDTLPQEERDYLQQDSSNQDASRIQWLLFDDGTEGAVILWGECCIASAVRFAPAGRVFETPPLTAGV